MAYTTRTVWLTISQQDIDLIWETEAEAIARADFLTQPNHSSASGLDALVIQATAVRQEGT